MRGGEEGSSSELRMGKQRGGVWPLTPVCSSRLQFNADGEPHYMKGGKPGSYPSFAKFPQPFYPLPVKLSLYDPFGICEKDTPEKKAKGLLAEINNGRTLPPSLPRRSFAPPLSATLPARHVEVRRAAVAGASEGVCAV